MSFYICTVIDSFCFSQPKRHNLNSSSAWGEVPVYWRRGGSATFDLLLQNSSITKQKSIGSFIVTLMNSPITKRCFVIAFSPFGRRTSFLSKAKNLYHLRLWDAWLQPLRLLSKADAFGLLSEADAFGLLSEADAFGRRPLVHFVPAWQVRDSVELI